MYIIQVFNPYATGIRRWDYHSTHGDQPEAIAKVKTLRLKTPQERFRILPTGLANG